MDFRERLAGFLFGDVIERQVQAAVKVVDDKWWRQVSGWAGPQDKPWYELVDDFADALEAWRTNPLAFRIVGLTTDYVVGNGITLSSEIGYIDDFIQAFWHHRKNRMPLRLYRWCDELTRAGELFIVLQTNPADGMSYVRQIPAAKIDKIETDENDLERELRYHEVTAKTGGRWWSAEDIEGPEVLHYAINRPVGAVRGQGDLAPILPWLRRYKEWLEDRVRVNRFRNAFLWKVTVRGAVGGDLAGKRSQYAKAPEPGSIIVTDENETWETVQPRIEAHEAKDDGRALRLMVAAGAGIPLHFLAEGESATRATAAEMGGPTWRHYEQRQLFFCQMLLDVVSRVIERAQHLGRLPRPRGDDLQLSYQVQRVAEEDNEALARSVGEVVKALVVMKEQGWITDRLAMEMVYKFAGQRVDINALLEELKEAEDEIQMSEEWLREGVR
ncbi:MAG: hypothetical protein ACE5LG_07760 [Anaerolineae bacterium]